MTDDTRLPRRGFVRLCATTVAAVTASPGALANAARAARPRLYRRVRLVDHAGHDMTPERLEAGRSYVFNYPYVTTPAFLLDLGEPALPGGPLRTEAGERYEWPGGVGPDRSVVAFSAICAHKMTHPARSVSFINYRDDEVRYIGTDERPHVGRKLIHCCSEKSVYDPAAGAAVLGGPAPQPLTTILVEHDAGDGALYALGTFGGEMYEKFFARFGPRIALEYRTEAIRRETAGTAEVVPIEVYSRTRITC